jgi:UDP-N-acetylmuramoyl-L-alanyl-D-glutamate--2,6-diaminopimelate ligase
VRLAVHLHDLLDGVPDALVVGARRPPAGPAAAGPVPAGPIPAGPVPAGAIPAGTVEVDAVVCDSRDTTPRSLFACIRGERHDGHDHAAAAQAAGASAVLVEHQLADVDLPQVVVPSVRAVLGPIAAALAGHPAAAMRVAGVTGTNGKTTVTHLLESIARAGGHRAAVLGTLGVRGPRGPVSLFGEGPSFTTPEAPLLQRALRAVREQGSDVVAMEVSSHALHYRRVDGTAFAAVGFTNLTPEHLDLHGTIEEYFAAKARLFTRDFCSSAAIVTDDAWGERLVRSARHAGLDVVKVSAHDRRADVGVQSAEFGPHGTRATLRLHGDTTIEVRLRLAGAFNLTNALTAAALAQLVGIDARAIAAGLTGAAPVPGRMERVGRPGPVAVLVDYAHTPDALGTLLRTVRDLHPDSRVVVVFGCGGDRDRSKRPAMGRIAVTGADVAIVTSDNPRSEDPAAIVADILAGLRPEDPRPLVELDRARAIAIALDTAVAGDVVVVAGKGHETGQTAHGVTVPFDDRAVGAALLEARIARCC